MRIHFSTVAVFIELLCLASPAFPCTRASPVSTLAMVKGSDAIVRALAVGYAVPPRDPKVMTTGEPDSRVRFEVREVIRGTDVKAELILAGYLTDRDDFNDHEAPYRFVRPNGRSGSCYANTYRSGAEFLLMLKKRPSGDYTVNWYALGPVNEQLRSESDSWLLWVRQQANRGALPDTPLGRQAAREQRTDSGSCESDVVLLPASLRPCCRLAPFCRRTADVRPGLASYFRCGTHSRSPAS